MGLIFDKIDKLPCADGGGGKYPHAGGANVDDGGVLVLKQPPSLVVWPVNSEQDGRVLGDSAARSFFTGGVHGRFLC